MILSAFGIVDSSPIQVSEILKSLSMSHSFVGGHGKTERLTVDGLCTEQPVWPVIIDRVKAVSKVHTEYNRLVYFVCDARAPLAICNLSQALWPEHRNDMDLEFAIRNALERSNELDHDWQLRVSEPTLDEYVNIASKPSFLNGVQGTIYRITPYALRKEVQKLCIAYLAGAVSLTAVKRKLKSSYKLADLLVLMDSDKARNLKDAVAATRYKTVEVVAKEYSVETFEVLYCIRSYEQNKG
jgi:hypothetical protein